MTGQGVSSFSSHSAAAGRTTPSANPWTQSRMSFWSWFSAIEKSFSGGWPSVGTWASAARAAASVGAAAASISGVAPLLAISLRAHGTDHPVSYRRLAPCKARTSGRVDAAPGEIEVARCEHTEESDDAGRDWGHGSRAGAGGDRGLR